MATAILTTLTQQYQAATSGWYNYLFPIANHLFGMLAVIELAWSGIWWALDKSDVTSLWAELLKKIIAIGFFYSLMLHCQTWIPAIIQSFELAGAGASHIKSLYPSDILDQGISLASAIFVPLKNDGYLNVGGWILGAFVSLAILICFAIIAGLLVVALVQSYIVVGAGVLLLGFSGSRWTTQYATGFLSYAMTVGTKLFVLFLIVGVGGTMASSWGSLIPTLSLKNMTPLFEVAGGSIVFTFIAWSIPHKAASLLSGASHATFTGLMTAATGTASVAMMPVRSGFGAAMALKEANHQAGTITQGHTAAGGSLGMGIAKGVVGAAFNLGVSALGSATGHYRNTSHAMAGKTQMILDQQAHQAEKSASSSRTTSSSTTQTSRPNNPPPPTYAPTHATQLTSAPQFTLNI